MDKVLLEYEMKRKGVSIDGLCASVGFSKSAFYRKCNGTSDFTLNEIKKIVEVLDLSTPMSVFFAEKVS